MEDIRQTQNSPLDLSENTPLLQSEPTPDESPLDGNPHNERKMFWEELHVLSTYTWPVLGTQLLEYSLVIAPTIAIGHISTTALAGITLGSMTANVSGFSVIEGFVSCLDTMLPSTWTSEDPKLVGLWCQRTALVMTIIIMPIFLIWHTMEQILLLLRQDPDVAHLAAIYLKWMSISLPAYVVNHISRRYFQSQGLFAVPTKIILIIAPINAFLNYFLVWGPPPLRIGFIGAPIATAISFNLMAIAGIIYGIYFTPHTAWHPFTRRAFDLHGLGIVMKLGVAGVGLTASDWWSWELIALAASLLGPVPLAAQSVLLVTCSTTYQAPFALSIAASVRIGNLFGVHNAPRAKVSAYTAFIMALLISGLPSAVLLIFRKSWGKIFNDDPKVLMLVASIIPLVALFQVFDAISAVSAGILRARGRQVTGALLNISAYYILGIPFGIYLAFSGKLGLHGLWIGLTTSLVCTAVIGIWLCVRTDWDEEVRKADARIREENGSGRRKNGDMESAVETAGPDN